MPWSVAFMVVAIVLVVTLGRVSREKYRAMGRLADDAFPAPDAGPARDEVRQLKERIAVLERVITDNHGSSNDLSRQIDELRDR